MQNVLGYKQWRSINDLIKRAKIACTESNNNIDDHFAVERKMMGIGSKASRKIDDYRLSRYACYLIVMNGNPKKEIIAFGQTYFAIQTRKQELTGKKYDYLPDDDKRLYQRNLIKQGNYTLQKVASQAGIKNMAEFHNSGYKGLYNGETANDIFKRKGLRYREDILDNMGEDEMIANLFRINQTKQKLIWENIQGVKKTNDAHYEVGKKVRKAIADIGGTMPEDIPTQNKSLKELEREKMKKTELGEI